MAASLRTRAAAAPRAAGFELSLVRRLRRAHLDTVDEVAAAGEAPLGRSRTAFAVGSHRGTVDRDR